MYSSLSYYIPPYSGCLPDKAVTLAAAAEWSAVIDYFEKYRCHDKLYTGATASSTAHICKRQKQ